MWVGELHMRHDAASEESVHQRSLGAVKKLVRQDNIAGMQSFAQAADRRDTATMRSNAHAI
jgi:hypothetical protein